MTSERRPRPAFDPRDFCREELAERGIAFQELPHVIRSWMNNREQSVTPKVALALSGVFGTSPQFWKNLDSAWRGERGAMASEDTEAGGTDPATENIWICSSEESYLAMSAVSPMDLGRLFPGPKEWFVCYEGEDGMLYGQTVVFS